MKRNIFSIIKYRFFDNFAHPLKTVVNYNQGIKVIPI